MLLQRVVSLMERGLLPEEEVMLDHRPHAGQVAVGEQDLPVVAAEKLVAEIDQAGGDVNPHERQVPLQRTAQPSADSKRLRPVQQIFLRNLRPKAGEGTENLQPAPYHDEQRDRIDPVTQTHEQWMLIHRASHGFGFFVLRANDFDDGAAHALTSRFQSFKVSRFQGFKVSKMSDLKRLKHCNLETLNL